MMSGGSDLAWYVHTHSYVYWENIKSDGKIAGLSKLELPGIDMLAQAKMAGNVS